MTKGEIINQIALQPKYLGICRAVAGRRHESLAEDLYQELFLFLLEMPDERLSQVYEGRFENYYFGMAKRQFESKSSRFNKVNLKPALFLREQGDDVQLFYRIYPNGAGQHDEELLRMFRRAMKELEQSNFVGAKLLELYAQRVSIKSVSIDSNVPIRSVYKIIKEARDHIKVKVERYKRMKQ